MSRFLLVLGHQLRGQLAPAWPGAGRPDRPAPKDGEWVAWRLLGSNHRELARSAGVFATADAAREGVARLRAGLDRTTVSSEALRGRWSWALSVDGIPVAVASRLYQRPRECAYNLAAAVAAMRVAELAQAIPYQRPTDPDPALEVDTA